MDPNCKQHAYVTDLPATTTRRTLLDKKERNIGPCPASCRNIGHANWNVSSGNQTYGSNDRLPIFPKQPLIIGLPYELP